METGNNCDWQLIGKCRGLDLALPDFVLHKQENSYERGKRGIQQVGEP